MLTATGYHHCDAARTLKSAVYTAFFEGNERIIQRLDRALGLCMNLSRKEAKALIKAGEVTVNGAPARDDAQKVRDGDAVTVCGKPICVDEYVYYMMNKPRGVVCATEDKHCRTALDLLPPELKRRGLFPAGRLDKDTEGLLIITNDGAFAHRMLAPKSHVPKRYRAELDGPIPDALPAAFASGLELYGGECCSPAEIVILRSGNNPVAEVTIYEGMYHQVKRMFASFSLNVTVLKRLAIGGLTLDDSLAPGSVRGIVHKELEQIFL